MKNTLIIGLILSLLFVGCAQQGSVDIVDKDAKVVAATFFPLYDFTRTVVGGTAQVYSIVPITSEPHSFRETPQDIIKLSNADIFVTLGAEFEAFEDRLIDASQDNLVIIPAGAGVELIEYDEDDHGEHGFEWAGLFELDGGEYTWTFAKVDGEYADPAMKMIILETDDSDEHGIEHVEETAEELLDSSNTGVKNHGSALVPREMAYELEFEEGLDVTSFTVKIDKKGYYVFFTEHMPFEFEVDEHFFKDADGTNMEPLAEEPETGHDHSHADEHDEDHEEHDEDHEEHDEEGHDEDDHHDHDHSGVDPHIWLSPNNVMLMVSSIEEGLSAVNPENAETYKANAQLFYDQLQTLDTEYEQALANCRKDTILVAHNAYSYLGRDYGFKTIEIAGLSPEAEPSPKQIAKLIDEAKEHDLKVIFYEELVDPRVSNAIADQVGATALPLYPAAYGEESDSYISIMRENLKNLVIALECT